MSFVGAVLHHTGRVTADTAGIRGGIYNVALFITAGELFQVRIQIQILQCRAFLVLAGIDVRLVGAVDDLPQVPAHNTTGAVGSGDAAGSRGVIDGSALLIDTRDTAHIGLGVNGSVEGTGQNLSAVAACHAANIFLGTGGRQGSLYM